MKDSKIEIHNLESATSVRTTRSVLERGRLLPLFTPTGVGSPAQSARGLAQSKTWRTIVVALCLLQSAFCLPAWGQSYAIDWWTADGGGGQSTGGVYTVSGTVGQPDAGQMSGGNYALSGGFWSLLAVVSTPGAPSLTVTRTTTNTVVVSWPSPSTGWNLEQNTNVTTTTWVTPPEGVTDDGSTKSIVVNPPAGNRFYRLHKP